MSHRPTDAPAEVLAAGRFARFVRVDGWEYVERTNVNGVVVIIAVTTDNKLVLVEQYRPPVRARVIELPAGLSGDGNATEPTREAALRELEEETGYTADNIEVILTGPNSAGLCSEVVTLFLAKGVRKVSAGGGVEGEDIVTHEVPVEGLLGWLQDANARGVLVDPKVLSALAFVGSVRG